MRQADAIRELFLGGKRSYRLDEAALLLAWPRRRLRSELAAQYLIPEAEWESKPVPWRAVAVLAVGEWAYARIEDVLAEQASALPRLVRSGTLSVRLPLFQIAVIRAAARRAGSTVDEFLSRHFADLTCLEAAALSHLSAFREAYHWPAPPPSRHRDLPCHDTTRCDASGNRVDGAQFR
jgi:hypothetical protein